jgi:hypothetical protein
MNPKNLLQYFHNPAVTFMLQARVGMRKEQYPWVFSVTSAPGQGNSR